jgi:hypothetical protein
MNDSRPIIRAICEEREWEEIGFVLRNMFSHNKTFCPCQHFFLPPPAGRRINEICDGALISCSEVKNLAGLFSVQTVNVYFLSSAVDVLFQICKISIPSYSHFGREAR